MIKKTIRSSPACSLSGQSRYPTPSHTSPPRPSARSAQRWPRKFCWGRCGAAVAFAPVWASDSWCLAQLQQQLWQHSQLEVLPSSRAAASAVASGHRQMKMACNQGKKVPAIKEKNCPQSRSNIACDQGQKLSAIKSKNCRQSRWKSLLFLEAVFYLSWNLCL